MFKNSRNQYPKRLGVPSSKAITAKLLNKNPNSVTLQRLSYKATFNGFIWPVYVDDSRPEHDVTDHETSVMTSPVPADFNDLDNSGPPYPPEYYEPYDRQDRRIWLWGILTLGLLGALVALIIVLVNFVQNTTSSNTDNFAIEQVEPVSPTGIIVPLVIDLDSSQAVALLQSRGLQVGRITTEVRNDVPLDRVLSQFPLQGTELEEGETVALVISVGPESIQVPIVVGLTQEEAFNRLQNQGFVNIEVRRIKTNEYDAGVVAEQEPEASSFIEPTTLIGLRIADGRISDLIPNLTGQPLSIALEELEELGWAVRLEEINSDSVADARVVSTLQIWD